MLQRIWIGMLSMVLLSGNLPDGGDRYVYDKLNRLTKVLYEDGSYVTYEYDANGNITHTEVYDASMTEPGETGEDPEEPGEQPDTPEQPQEPGEQPDTPEQPEEPGETPDTPENPEEGEQSFADTVMDVVHTVTEAVKTAVTTAVETVKAAVSKAFHWIKSLWK